MHVRKQLALVAVAVAALFPSGMAFAQEKDTKALPDKMTIELGGGVKMDFVLIHPGSFQMGSEKGRHQERPVHEVRISKPFYMGVYEVTQAQWKTVMGDNPSRFKGDDLPVETVSWDDCQGFIEKLKAKVGGGMICRLPTEAEWEYACRAGSKTEYCFGDQEGGLDEYAWYGPNSGPQTHPVGQKKPNAWGLYDMHGNVWEWCADWDGPYGLAAIADPKGPESGIKRVIRGGAWSYTGTTARSAVRGRYTPGQRHCFCGFRVACSSP